MNMNQGQNPEKNPAGNFDFPMAGRFVRKIFPVLLLSALLQAWTSTAWTSGQEVGQDNRVLRATLHNGLRVVIVFNPLAPVASIVVNYRVGSNEAPDDFPGTAHALEHMMFRGSPGLSGKQLANVTAAIGGSFNADTQQTVTQYFFAVPVEDLDIALHIESLRMRGILADEKSWGQERGAIEQEVAQDLSSPEYVAYTKLLANLYGLVTEGKALSVGFSTNTFPETAVGYAVASFPKGADADALIEAVYKTLADGAQSGFSPDLVEAAERQEITAAELKRIPCADWRWLGPKPLRWKAADRHRKSWKPFAMYRQMMSAQLPASI